ncbi:hypothetical protein PUN28_014150 [Cardiocondyla obscurior]|uniref:Uncharacterized protein n=1 Tax=Cardiocondyla obscurior TaxID=286306 RepID=A0AAW2EYR3_9HYME
MACDNETDTLELRIKVNGQNLSTISDKYNISTLRVPSDPTWPKIPQRRSNNNTDDIIEPPCVVTLTGSPRKSHSIVQTVVCQHLKSKVSQKNDATTHIPRRLPGSFDPRFRKQILRQKTEKPDELSNRKNDKQIPELDVLHIPQEVEKKLKDESQKIDKRVDNYISPFYDVNNLSSSGVGSSTNTVDEQSILEAKHLSNNPLQHTLPINTFNTEPVSSPIQPSLQCYNLQIPVVAYRDVSLPISSTNMPIQVENIKLTSACNENNGVEQYHHRGISEHYHGEVCKKEKIDSNVSSCQNCTKDCSSIADNEKKVSNEKEITKTWMPSCVNQAPKENTHFTYCVKERRDKVENNNVQIFPFSSDNKCCKDDKKEKKKDERKRNAERLINIKHKTIAPINLPRKVKSFFRKKSRLATTDSDCTLILPGYRYLKGNRYKKTKNPDRSKLSLLSLPQRNGINSINSIVAKYNTSKRGRINCNLLTNLRMKKSLHKSSSIPPETRELLNKSYWEYYWKLKRKVVSKLVNSNNSVGKKDNLPESQTLRQCSVLSCMINQALEQDSNSVIAKGRSFSDPVVNVTSHARECIHQVSDFSSELAKKIKQKRIKRESKRLLGLRAVALLCVALYVTIIFLPMMYDNFFVEEYDENANYVELIFLYIASSFEETLDGIINILCKILLPIKFDRK